MGTICVSNLGKAYKQYPNRWARLEEWLDPLGQPRHQLHWELKGINFNVDSGEAVGIIGINGAGKSTLLKMITGTVQPTTGNVSIRGRVAALLELGMGFHPDFTGRQNALMAAQLYGYSIDEISSLMPDIQAFADIGDYIDQPLRIYSSGMQIRLAFAVASASRPDVLIIDEALSVGDTAFQRKCFQRIESFQAAGTTLLFVSHDIETIKKLCTRALFINAATMEFFGEAKSVCDEYEKFLFGGNGKTSKLSQSDGQNEQPASTAKFDPTLAANCEMVYGNGMADIKCCWLEDLDGNHINVIDSGMPFRWCYHVKFNEDVESPIFAMMLKTREGVAIYGTTSSQADIGSNSFSAGEQLVVSFKLENHLAPGVFYLNCGVRIDTNNGMEFLSRRIDSGILRVTSSHETTTETGLTEMKAQLAIRRL